MIFGHFTEQAQQAMKRGIEIARELNQPYVGTEHLLIGLMGAQDSVPSAISATVSVAQLRELISQSRGDTVMETMSPVRLELTSHCRRVVEVAMMEARSLGQNIATIAHLWKALFSVSDCVALKMLSSLGVDLTEAGNEINQMVAKHQAQSITFTPPVIQQKKSEKSPQEGNSTSPKKDAAERRYPFLEKYCRDLTDAAAKGKLDPVIGRDVELQRMAQILIRRTKNNPVLIGEPGVGKSAVAEGLAQRIISGAVPEMLAGKRVLSLDINSMVAGTKYRGEFEERMKNLLDELRKSGDVILFIDELHNIIGAGGSEGSMDAANILKPVLARGELQCIGATTIAEYRKHIEKDAALERRFQPVTIGEPTPQEALAILQGLRKRYEEHHGIRITDEALSAAVSLSDRYIADRFLPDKAVDLMDEAASRIRIDSFTAPPDLHEQEKALAEASAAKRDAIAHQQFEQAAACRDRERALETEIRSKRAEWEKTRAAARTDVTAEDVARVVSQWTGIPVSRMTETEADRLLHLEEVLHRRVIGQEEAVSAVSRAIRRARTGLKDPKRPIGSFIFLGPTGVGKTELCRALGEAMFGDEDALIRVDMSEYMEKHTTSRLVGSPPGYVGYEEGGQLTEAVRRKPYSVILFDEIEKAHPDVFNILLQLLDDGRLTDNTGRVVSFKNTIVVMTSNAGAHDIASKRTLGFGSRPVADEQSYDAMKDAVMKQVRQVFRPEFINRIDEMIVFHSLGNDEIRTITELMLGQVASRLNERGIHLTWTQKAAAYLAEAGFDPKFGARPLRRVIQRTVEDTLSEELLLGHISLGHDVRLVLKDGRIAVKKVEEKATEAITSGFSSQSDQIE